MLQHTVMVLDNSVLPTLLQQFGEDFFQFQHDNVPVHKAKSINPIQQEGGINAGKMS